MPISGKLYMPGNNSWAMRALQLAERHRGCASPTICVPNVEHATVPLTPEQRAREKERRTAQRLRLGSSGPQVHEHPCGARDRSRIPPERSKSKSSARFGRLWPAVERSKDAALLATTVPPPSASPSSSAPSRVGSDRRKPVLCLAIGTPPVRHGTRPPEAKWSKRSETTLLKWCGKARQ